ncbi:MAG: dTMP kinase [Firmicutes bacterium]|nr:dTMP kinase [Bacillota bacterium]
MKHGLFITLEGPDGSGKTTQIEKMREYLQDQGNQVLVTREPGGTSIGERLRELILSRESEEMDPLTEALLYAAARAQHVEQVIRPALEKGKFVICDRFIDSSIAYQGYGRRLGDSVSIINAYAVKGCMPDATFLLKLDPAMGRNRIEQKQRDRIELEHADFHELVFHGYEELELQYPQRIIGIDASREISEVTEDILQHLERLLER